MKTMLQKENISAYLDDELSPMDCSFVEEKLMNNNILRQDFEAMKFVKETVGTLKPLPDDEYFYTRLQEKIKDATAKRSQFAVFKKPVLIFGTFSLLLMLIFRYEPSFFKEFFDEQKENLNSLYTKNLQPLLYTAGFSSEDLFNFAFNNVLPLNKESNQVLAFGTDNSGKGFLEVKNAGFGSPSMSLERFVTSLGLKDSEIKIVDSILRSYTDEIASTVLVNENNTVAVNSNLWEYQNALQADVISYISSVNKNMTKVYAPDVNISTVDLKRLSGSMKNIPKSDLYYLIASDTVFSQELDVDMERFTNEFTHSREELNSSLGGLRVKVDFNKDFNYTSSNVKSKNNLHVFLDSNSCRVIIPRMDAFVVMIPELDSLMERLDTLTSSIRQFSVTVNIDSLGRKNSYKYKMKSFNSDSLKEFTLKNLIPKGKGITVFSDTVFNNLNKFFKDSLNTLKNYSFNLETLDSLSKFYNYSWEDSINVNFNVPRNLKKELELLRKEMNKFREEMQNFRKDIKPEKKITTKPIEI